MTIENESLRVTVQPDRGGDISELFHKPTATQFLWSRFGERMPTQPQAGTGGDFLDQYAGGWHEMLPNFGPGRLSGAEFGLCGEATMLAWDAEMEQQGTDPWLRLEVRLRRVPLRLTKRLRLSGEEPTLLIEEIVRNEGAQAVDYAWGQHAVLGADFLGPRGEIEAPGKRVISTGPGGPRAALVPGTEGDWPMLEAGDGSRLDLSRVRPDTPGWEEDICLVDIEEGWVGVTDRERELGFGLAWETEVFPHLWLWENFGGRFDHPWFGAAYSLGLEPLSSYPFGIEEIVEAGTQRTLEAGEEIKARLCATIYRPRGRLAGITLEGDASFQT